MTSPDLDARRLTEALGPLLRRVGGQVVPGGAARPDDVAVAVEGGPTVHVRLPSTGSKPTVEPTVERAGERTVEPTGSKPTVERAGERTVERAVERAVERTVKAADLSDGLARLIADVERELGGPLADLPRPGKQRAVRLLEERGAFEMRRSAETVAEALGVTRFTVYNYLNRRTTA